MSFVDYIIQVRAWQRPPITPDEYDETRADNITVLIPAFGSPSYLTGIRQLGVKTTVVTTDHETTEFEQALSSLGVGVIRAPIAGPHSYKLLRYGVHQVDTPYVLFLDADTEVGDSIAKIPVMMATNELDIASFRVLPKTLTTLAERLQHFEYALSMNARKVYPWLISGAATVGRTAVL